MKKKIIALSAALMLFAGVVSASSINGDYKGNPIVKIMSNGKQLETDEVPAVILDGHTVVPISTLRQLGASVTWDAYGYSVDVKLPTSSSAPTQSGSTDIDKLKALSETADFYRRLIVLGDMVASLNGSNSLALDAIRLNHKDTTGFIKDADDLVKSGNQNVYDIAVESNALYDILIKYNIDISDVKEIITDYDKAVNLYDSALTKVKNYYSSGSNADYSDYLNYSQQAFELLKKPRVASTSKYFEYYKKIQNY